MRNKHHSFALLSVIAATAATFPRAVNGQVDDTIFDPDVQTAPADPVLAELRTLDPLPKPHPTWPIEMSLLYDRDRLVEFARITGCVSGSGRWWSADNWARAASAAADAGAVVAVNWSPFVKDRPKNDQQDAIAVGEKYQNDLRAYRQALRTVADACDAAGVTVGWVLLDHEQYTVNDATRSALLRKLTAYRYVADLAAPTARVIYYNLGAVRVDASAPDGWGVFPRLPMEIAERLPGTPFCCSLYTPLEVHHQRAVFNRTAGNAVAHNVTEVVPWVSIGNGWIRSIVGRKLGRRWEGPAFNVPVAYSYQLGAELNNPWFGREFARSGRFIPNEMVPAVVIYPGPEDPRITNWWRDFVAYVLGATNRGVTPFDENTDDPTPDGP